MKVKLSDAFDLQMGKTPTRNDKECWGKGHKWISIGDIGNTGKYISTTKEEITDAGISRSGIKVVPKGTVIMSFKLSIGKTAIAAEDMYTNEAIMAFINKGKYEIDTDYLYHMCKGIDWFEGTNKAVLGLTLNKATMSEKEIEIPPLDVQLQVVAVLDKVDELISLRKEQLAKLDQLVKSRFIELFGDPIVNEKRWDTKPLLEMGSCKNGMNFHYEDAGVEINCLGVGDFKDYSIIRDTSILPTVSLNEMPSADYLLQDDDIVFVRSNGNKALVGRSVAVYPRDVPTTFSGFCIRYRKTDEAVIIPYLLRVLKAESVRQKMAGRGANIQNLNQQILGTLKIPVPPIELQNQFATFVEQTDKSKLAIQQSLDKLELLKKSLMQEYFG